MLTEKDTDSTMSKNYMRRMEFLSKEYELTKNGIHPRFRFVTDFYKTHNIHRQNFLKYYHRYKESNNPRSFLPRKRGPKYSTRRTLPFIENKVIELRKKGINRYEICDILKEKLGKFTPSPSGIYKICKRYNMNKLTKPMKENKRTIIKEQIGELGHIDCHYLPKGMIMNNDKRLYIVGVLDDCSRLAWCELTDDIQGLTVMFAIMRCLKALRANYGIEFREVITDNGPEFGGISESNQMTSPVKRLLYEMGIKHRRIKPYRPQTNGKIERFWRALEEEFVEETVFESREELEEELLKYMVYYNEYRPHQGIDGKKPAELCKEKLSKNE